MVPNQYESWAVANGMLGRFDVQDDARLSGPIRGLIGLLSACNVERTAVLQAWAAGQPEGDAAVLQAIKNAVPGGPPPGPEADGPDWGPLSLNEPPVVPSFPTHCLAGPAQRLIEEVSTAIGCPSDFPGLACLTVLAGAVGRSACLMLKPGYFAESSLYGAIVGRPSRGKTPAIKIVAAPLRSIGEKLAREHQAELEAWRASRPDKRQGNGRAKRDGPDDEGGARALPRPKGRRLAVDDATMEALILLNRDNPRGLVMVRDELTAFLLGMNQYKGGKGSDRAIVLKIWSGDEIVKDRVKDQDDDGGSVRVPFPKLSIIGGISPEFLKELADPKNREDGFIDRFLMVYPDPPPMAEWSRRGVGKEAQRDWSDLVHRLWERPLCHLEDRDVPHVVEFSEDGNAAWRKRYNAHVAEANGPGFEDALSGPWGKLGEMAGRLCLVLALADQAARPLDDPNALPEVDADVVGRAWTLIDYFKAHAKRCHVAMSPVLGPGQDKAAKSIVAWLRNGKREKFTLAELKREKKWLVDLDAEVAIQFLIGRNVIRPAEIPLPGPMGGRPPSSLFLVNPRIRSQTTD